MYGSRIEELEAADGEYTNQKAAVDFYQHIQALKTDNLEELTYATRKRIHNLKYYTWVEQQARDVAELNAQWYDYDNTWEAVHNEGPAIDALINEFNERTGLLKNL